MKILYKKILICMFFTTILVPTLFMWVAPYKSILNENRELSTLPTVPDGTEDLKRIPIQLKNYFQDNFFLRVPLIKLYTKLSFFLGKSPSEEVEIGKNGWLFYSGEDSLAQYKNSYNVSTGEKEKLANLLIQRRNLLKAQGIDYVVIISPNKGTIYDEFLPAKIWKKERNPLENHYIDYLKDNTDLKIIDFRFKLRESKKHGRLYHKHDSHWNLLGALHAQEELVDSLNGFLNTSFKKVYFDHHKGIWQLSSQQDLTKMIGAEGRLYEKIPIYEVAPVNGGRYYYDDPGNHRSAITSVCQKCKGRALLLRASFTELMVQFYANYFSYARYYWVDYTDEKTVPFDDLVNETQPTVVIDEIVERYLKFMARKIKSSSI